MYISSDHNALVERFKIKLKKVRKATHKKRWNLRNLKEQGIRETVTKSIAEQIEKVKKIMDTGEAMEKISEQFNEIGKENLTDRNTKVKS